MVIRTEEQKARYREIDKLMEENRSKVAVLDEEYYQLSNEKSEVFK